MIVTELRGIISLSSCIELILVLTLKCLLYSTTHLATTYENMSPKGYELILALTSYDPVPPVPNASHIAWTGVQVLEVHCYGLI